MRFRLIDDPAGLDRLCRGLGRERRIALDCEASGFHRYSDRLCLLQLTTSSATHIVDTLALDPAPALRGPLADPETQVLMHGADYDLRLLDRDLGLSVRGLFDTQVAAALLGEKSTGLAALLERYHGVKLSKKHQRADWARRPLPGDMLEYAAADTEHLAALADRLRARLERADRLEWADEECRLLERTCWSEEGGGEDPACRVRGARELGPREVTALRQALAWRDRIARARDRAPFRVAGDDTLVKIAADAPASVSELKAVRGMNSELARREGADLLRRLARVAQLPETELTGYPHRSGALRPPQDVEQRAERLKRVRNRWAEELEIERGVLLPNALLLELARRRPRSLAELAEVAGLRKWQAELLGAALLAALA
ncbi:MAG: ribonuclease D [Gemmatimonadota bacterium]|nr:ribonuclease D [Gemmatimonadota bacterium]